MITHSPEVFQSIVNFIKLTPLRELPNHAKWIRDEFDLMEAVSVVRDHVADTARMEGKPMYAGESSFDFCEDLRRAFEEVYLSCREQKDVIFQRKRNLVMYHLAIDPIIDDLGQYPHREVLESADQYFADIIAFIENADTEVYIDDALVMHEIVKAKTRTREEERKQNLRRRKTVKRSSIDSKVDIDPSDE
jgi:hypothetical protein